MTRATLPHNGKVMTLKPIIAAIAVIGGGLVSAAAAAYAIDETTVCQSGCTENIHMTGVFDLDPADAMNVAAWARSITLQGDLSGNVATFSSATGSINRSASVIVTADLGALTFASNGASEGFLQISGAVAGDCIEFTTRPDR